MKEMLIRSDKYSNIIGVIGLIILLAGFSLQILEILTNVSIFFIGLGLIFLIYFLLVVLFGYETLIYESDINKIEKFVNRVNSEINENKFNFLNEYTPERINRVIRNLETAKRQDLIPNIVNKFISNIDSKSKGMRMKTIKFSRAIINGARLDRDVRTYSNITDKFMTRTKIESDKKIYVELADTLEESAKWFLDENYVDKTADIVNLFKNQMQNKDEGFKNRYKIAEKILKHLPDKEFIETIIKHLRSNDENAKIYAYEIVRNLEDGAILPIIRSLEKIYYTKDGYRDLRRIVITALKSFGESSCLLLLRELDRKISVDYAKIIIDVAPEIGYTDIIVEYLGKRLDSYGRQIRPLISDFLSRQNL